MATSTRGNLPQIFKNLAPIKTRPSLLGMSYPVMESLEILETQEAESCQKLWKVAKSSQKLPKAAKSCQKQPKVVKSCEKLPKVAKSCQK